MKAESSRAPYYIKFHIGDYIRYCITYEPDTTVTTTDPESIKLPVPLQQHLGTDLTDLGEKEQYRSPFDIRSGNRRDDYAGLIRLCQVAALPQAEFDAQIASALDLDEALRMIVEMLCGVGDTYISYAVGLPHNLRLITFPDGDPAQLLEVDIAAHGLDYAARSSAHKSVSDRFLSAMADFFLKSGADLSPAVRRRIVERGRIWLLTSIAHVLTC